MSEIYRYNIEGFEGDEIYESEDEAYEAMIEDMEQWIYETDNGNIDDYISCGYGYIECSSDNGKTWHKTKYWQDIFDKENQRKLKSIAEQNRYTILKNKIINEYNLCLQNLYGDNVKLYNEKEFNKHIDEIEVYKTSLNDGSPFGIYYDMHNEQYIIKVENEIKYIEPAILEDFLDNLKELSIDCIDEFCYYFINKAHLEK